MSKRKPLDTLEIAAQAKAKVGKATPAAAAQAASDTDTITTAIHIPIKTWRLMRAVAFKRAQEHGGRASVSALIAELAERHRKELEEEAGQFLY